MTAPTWLRTAMLVTAAMNLLAAFLFLPGAESLRALAGMPPGAPPVYLATIMLFVLLFGAGYFWVGVTGRAEPLFVTLAAVGKIAFVTILVSFASAGTLSWRAPVVASGDLLFGLLFLRWLVAYR
jgi:hypothetical protein